MRAPLASLVIVIFAYLQGCNSAPQAYGGDPDQLIDGVVSNLQDSDFSLKKISTIYLYDDKQLLAIVRHGNISVKNGKQISSWAVEYIAKDTVLEKYCGEYWELFKDRLIDKPGVLMLNSSASFLDIGWRDIDNVITVYNRELIFDDAKGAGEYSWRYETSSGIVCSGTVGFMMVD